MKILKGIKLKAIVRADDVKDSAPPVSKQALQDSINKSERPRPDLQIKVSGVKAISPGVFRISFVIKGEYEAASDFAAYTSGAVRSLFADAPRESNLQGFIVEKVTEV